ncbi:MAG: acyl carrier protein [Bacteroidota bacterium]
MEKLEIIEKINHFLVEEFEIEKDNLTPEALLKDDLGIDSLDFVDIIVIIEKNFGFKVKGEEMVNVKTLQDFYDYVEAHVN